RKVKKPVLILSSRTPNKASVRERIKELEENGAKVVLKETDISVESQVTELIRGVREEYGCINGIIHCAGVIRDNYIKKKSVEELGEVFAPKVRGVAYLDQASKEEALDFFILFSSGSGVLGNPGQADYAAANAYMDVYTEHRNELIAKEQRQGRTLTINWPLWKEGGMQVSKATEKLMQGKGLEVLDTIKGLHAFYQAWVSNCSQVVIVEGDALELRRQLLIQGEGNTGNEEQMHDKTEETEDVDNRMLENKVQKAT
ncbi:SDR family NAD(P)-dependent oxidoreductase, partial [Paenibacillus alba]|uniref:SDR family NAD(P)-dependent oxidoreductase n=1 Tax=Paenibacillus alba TaxID=1197127 RepID=UPI001565674A